MSHLDRHVALGPTLLESNAEVAPRRNEAAASLVRSTVLPRGSSPDLAASPTTSARFEPIRSLGRGGMGEVTLVRDHDIDRTVAVKRLRSGAGFEHAMARFCDEIRTVGGLEHPNIAAIHDVGVDADGQHYFVMPFVDGETLESVIAKLAAGDRAYHRRFTFDVRVQIFHGLLNAIHYAHAKGVLHRDIKPANVMVGPFGEVLMMDWGIAKKRTNDPRPGAPASESDDDGGSELDRVFRTRHGTLLGTPAYMAPEQACGLVDQIDERSDIYSLCVVLYELLTLQHYLPGHTTIADMLAAVIAKPHPHASSIANPHQPPVPVELGWFVQVGLAKDPAQRYQTTGEMLAELQRALNGSFEVRCYMTFMKRSGVSSLRFIDSHPRAVLAGAIAGIAAAAFGVVSLLAGVLG